MCPHYYPPYPPLTFALLTRLSARSNDAEAARFAVAHDVPVKLLVDDNDVKENTVVLKEVLNEITGDLGRAKAALRSADRELERLHVM